MPQFRNCLILNIFMESGIKKSPGNVKLKCILSETHGHYGKTGKSFTPTDDLFWLKNNHFYNINKLRIKLGASPRLASGLQGLRPGGNGGMLEYWARSEALAL